ncbi:ABC transporter permease [Lacticaseibacillus mingshuiensis]|uniref:ABC transporter permease n=1 Tax=Lacticaseibacillus mingshuiensis TaxID=2799574 RepID=A0ABW4CJU1_9LACO|nr:ABC transporter permease [Lacticaseibacillus mingshuiensis]
MNKLWKTRLARHSKEQFKYLQLVFNDHFVLALIILLGALLYGYSQLIHDLTPQWWFTPALAAVLALVVGLGDLATLAEGADATFLLPRTSDFAGYLFRARRYSALLPLATLLLATLAAWPLLGVLHHGDWLSLGLILLALWLFKDVDLWLQLLGNYTLHLPIWLSRAALILVAWAGLMAGIWIHPVITTAVALACDLLLRWRIGDWFQPAQLDWQLLIKRESARMGRIYRFYNLFTDVPGIGGGVHRRKYLDVFTKLVPKRYASSWAYLYVRGFLRRTEFFGLFLRLAVIGAAILAFVQQWWLAGLFALLFVYLVGFQLLPFYLAYDEIVFTHLYPLSLKQKKSSFGRLVLVLLLLMAVILAVGAALSGAWLKVGVVLAAGVALAVVFALWYLPLRLAKLDAR